MMKFDGVQITVSCAAWEQVDMIGAFWECARSLPNSVGVGRNWANNTFEYAIGVLDGEIDEAAKLGLLSFSGAKPVEFCLPKQGWNTVRGKTADIRQIYERDLDSGNKRIKYEIERINEDGTCEISVIYEREGCRYE